jgi:hypothetical protein
VGDISIFRHSTEKFYATLSDRAASSYKQRVEKGKIVPLNQNAEKFLAAVGWSEDEFVSAYGACYSIMGEKRITEKERLSKVLAQRILAISGLSWNTESKNRSRDWERYACAATGETALVQVYRKKLLISCPPARVLRKDLHDLFISWTTNRAQIPTGGQSGLNILHRWEFADNIYIGEDEIAEQPMDFSKMREEWGASLGTGKTSKASKIKVAKVKKDSIDSMLQMLKSNKFLHCSDPKASNGTLESLAAFAISVLGHVI